MAHIENEDDHYVATAEDDTSASRRKLTRLLDEVAAEVSECRPQ